MGPHRRDQLLDRLLAAHETSGLDRQVTRHRVQGPQRRELAPQTVGANLEDPVDAGQVPQGMLAQIDQIDPVEPAPAVTAAKRIWPPCPAAITRAARFSAGPK